MALTSDTDTRIQLPPPVTEVARAPATESTEEGQQAAEDLMANFEGLDGFPGHVPQSGTESAFIYASSAGQTSDALARAKDDPAFAAAFFDTLGPEATASIVNGLDSVTSSGPMSNDTFNISDADGTQLLQDFGAALGAASRADAGTFDSATFMRELTGRGGETRLDTELAAILLNEGDFSTEAAVELGAHVLLNDDPPQSAENETPPPPHREELLQAYSGAPSDANGAWPTAIRGIMKAGASSELLALQETRVGEGGVTETYSPVAERLMDPDLVTSSVVANSAHGTAPPRVNDIPALVGAVLEQPVTDLRNNPSDPAAMQAVESVLLAGANYHGRVNEDGANALGAMYVAFAPEILNAGEGASAFALAVDSPLGTYLADSRALSAGDGSYAITAALQADGTPPVDRTMPGELIAPGYPPIPQRYESWSAAVQQATATYRAEVVEHGAPTNESGGQDLDKLAMEIADIDGEMLVGTYGNAAITAADEDAANAAKQQAFNILSDYIGFGVGLVPGAGVPLSGGATVYNTHLEGPMLEAMFPTDKAEGTFNETIPREQQQMLAAQTFQIVDSAGRSGAVTLPDNLRDPETGGLRTASGEEAEQFVQALLAFVESNQTVHSAVDLARAQLQERATALDAGQYRGGG